MQTIKEKIPAFVERLQEQVRLDFLKWGKESDYSKENYPRLTCKISAKYTKIIASDADGGATRVFGFIDNENGGLMKAAGWNAPAKNFYRGNIEDQDITYIRWTSIA